MKIDLYLGDGTKAYQYICSQWKALRRSLLLRVQHVRIYALDLRALAAIAAARSDPLRRKALLKQAEADASSIAAEHAGWSDPIAALLRGLVAAARGDRTRAVRQLREAIRGFDETSMELHAAATRRRLAELVSDEEERPLIDAWLAYMKREKVENPERMTASVAPDVLARLQLTSG